MAAMPQTIKRGYFMLQIGRNWDEFYSFCFQLTAAIEHFLAVHPIGQTSAIGGEYSSDFIADSAEHDALSIIVTFCVCWVIEDPAVVRLFAREIRTALVGIATDADDYVNLFVSEIIQRLGDCRFQIVAYFGHDLDG